MERDKGNQMARKVKFMAVVLSALFLLYGMFTKMPMIGEQKNEISSVTEEIRTEEQRKLQLNELQKTYGSDEYVERIARSRLLLVKPDERIFIDLQGNK